MSTVKRTAQHVAKYSLYQQKNMPNTSFVPATNHRDLFSFKISLSGEEMLHLTALWQSFKEGLTVSKSHISEMPSTFSSNTLNHGAAVLSSDPSELIANVGELFESTDYSQTTSETYSWAIPFQMSQSEKKLIHLIGLFFMLSNN